MKPNNKNIDLVIKAIRDEKNHFSILQWRTSCGTETHDCGTPSCIGGHAENIMKNSDQNPYGDETKVLQWLVDDVEEYDETRYLIDRLFYPKEMNNFKISRDDAITMLEKFKSTSEVDWSHLTTKIPD